MEIKIRKITKQLLEIHKVSSRFDTKSNRINLI